MLLKIQTAIYDVLMFYKVFSLHIFAKFSSNNYFSSAKTDQPTLVFATSPTGLTAFTTKQSRNKSIIVDISQFSKVVVV